LPVPAGLPPVRLRLRGGHGLAAVRDHSDHHRDPGEVRQQVRLLRGGPLMSTSLRPLPPQPRAERVPETLVATVPQRSRWRRTVARPKSFAARVVLAIVLVGFSLIFLYPFAWLVAASLKPRGEVFDNALIPKTFTPGNYAEVWSQLPLLSWMGNSIGIALLAATAVAVSSSIVAFGFAYFRFPGRG